MKLISELEILFDISELFEEIPAAKWSNFLRRQVRSAMTILGMTSNTHLQSKWIEVDENGAFPVPEEATELWEVLIVDVNGNAVEPSFGTHRTFQAASSLIINIPNRVSNAAGAGVVVRYDPSARCVFIENYNHANTINGAILTYLAPLSDDNGDLLVPEEAREAIMAFLDFKIKSRLRNRNSDAFPQTEIESARNYWHHMAGHARGRLAKTPRPVRRDFVRRTNYFQHYPGVKRKIGA